MGFSTVEIERGAALSMALNKKVIEASREIYFTQREWHQKIEKAEIGDNGRLYFTLKNEDFVTVEL